MLTVNHPVEFRNPAAEAEIPVELLSPVVNPQVAIPATCDKDEGTNSHAVAEFRH
jgi:hypothetical protein